MDDKPKKSPKKWKRRLKFFFLVSSICIVLILIGMHVVLMPRKNCWLSRQLGTKHPINTIIEPITTDNIHNLTYLMGYSGISLVTTDGGNVRYSAFLSDDDQILVVTGVPFIFPTKTFHTGRTTATWELGKDKAENPLCYLYVGQMGSINREAIAISSDNRYVLLEQSYQQANCQNYACIFVYDRERNLEIPYHKFDQGLFDFELTKDGYYSAPYTSYCLNQFESPELFQFFSNQLDDKECISSIILSSDSNFVVILIVIEADSYIQSGRIEIWGVID